MSTNQQETIPKQFIEQDNIKYSINKEEKTSSVIGYNEDIKEVLIPRSIIYESTEYFVTSISKNAFKHLKVKSIEFAKNSKLQTIEEEAFSNSSIESITIPSEVIKIGKSAFSNCDNLQEIEFAEDSKLQTIEEEAFSNSSIESITIPSKVTDLKEKWCGIIQSLSKIRVSSSNPRYFCLDEKMIIGKSSIESTDYDCLVFCIRNIKTITIPNFIKYICSDAFSWSSIEEIIIPTEVTVLGKNSFSFCKNLRSIEFAQNSKLQIIEPGAFIVHQLEV